MNVEYLNFIICFLVDVLQQNFVIVWKIGKMERSKQKKTENELLDIVDVEHILVK
jgi:hypothetical protein